MVKRTTRTIVAVCALSLPATACGDGDDGASGASVEAAADTPIGRALTAEFMADQDSVVGTEAEARCMSGQIVSEIGEDRLVEAGITAENVGDVADYDFDDDEIDAIVGAMFACVDIRASLVESFEADFGSDGATCVADELDEEFVRDLMRSEFTGGAEEPTAEFLQAFLDIAAKCDLALD